MLGCHRMTQRNRDFHEIQGEPINLTHNKVSPLP